MSVLAGGSRGAIAIGTFGTLDLDGDNMGGNPSTGTPFKALSIFCACSSCGGWGLNSIGA